MLGELKSSEPGNKDAIYDGIRMQSTMTNIET